MKVRRIRLRPDGKTDRHCPYAASRRARWCAGPRCPEWEDTGKEFRLAPVLHVAGYVILPISAITIAWSILNFMLHHLALSIGILLLGIGLAFFLPIDESSPDRFGRCRKVSREGEEAEERGGYLKG